MSFHNAASSPKAQHLALHGEETLTVREGDTVGSLCAQIGCTREEFFLANPQLTPFLTNQGILTCHLTEGDEISVFSSSRTESIEKHLGLTEDLKDVAQDQVADYRKDLRALAEEKAQQSMPPGTAEILSPLLDLVESGSIGVDSLKKALAKTTGAGVAVACTIASKGILAPVCGAAGAVVSSLLEGLMGGSPPAKEYVSTRDLMIVELRQEKMEVETRLLSQVQGERGRDKIRKLIDQFYDERVTKITNYPTTGPQVDLYVWQKGGFWGKEGGKVGNPTSLFWEEPWGGGFFSMCSPYYQVLPFNADKEWWTNLYECKYAKFYENCSYVAADRLNSNALQVAIQSRREWAEALIAYWRIKMKDHAPSEFKHHSQFMTLERSNSSPDDLAFTLSNMDTLMIKMHFALQPYIERIFKDLATSIVAEDVAERQAPVLETLERVTQKMNDTYLPQCDSDTCKDYVAAKIRRMSRELVQVAARGLSPEQLNEVISEAELDIKSTVQLATTVEETSSESKKSIPWWGWMLIGTGVVGGGAAIYRTSKGLPVLPTNWSKPLSLGGSP